MSAVKSSTLNKIPKTSDDNMRAVLDGNALSQLKRKARKLLLRIQFQISAACLNEMRTHSHSLRGEFALLSILSCRVYSQFASVSFFTSAEFQDYVFFFPNPWKEL